MSKAKQLAGKLDRAATAVPDALRALCTLRDEIITCNVQGKLGADACSILCEHVHQAVQAVLEIEHHAGLVTQPALFGEE